MATIKEVAHLAQVSVATVSRVLNDPETVKETTRIVVQDAIKALNYSPNFLGRNLRQSQTRRILVILDSISNQFYSRVVRGIEETARQQDFSVMICTVRGNKQILLEHLSMLQSKIVDGAIVLCADLAPKEVLEFSQDYPLVCACEPSEANAITSVCVDNYKAGMDAVNYLIERGKKRIALVGYPQGEFISYSSNARFKGYLAALTEHQIPFDESLILSVGYTYNAGVRAANILLKSPCLPDAVFCLADACAIGLIKKLHEQGISVPDDISVMGFDGTAMSEVFIPSITTVAQPQYEIGQTAMNLLFRKLNGTQHEDSVFLPHRIIERDSV